MLAPGALPESVACIAVGYGQKGAADFVKGQYWKGPVDTTGPFVDEEPAVPLFTHVTGNRSLGASGLLSFKVLKASVGGKSKTDPSKKGGNQWNLGATVLVDVTTGEPIWSFHQKGFADHPDIDALLAAVETAVKTAEEENKSAEKKGAESKE